MKEPTMMSPRLRAGAILILAFVSCGATAQVIRQPHSGIQRVPLDSLKLDWIRSEALQENRGAVVITDPVGGHVIELHAPRSADATPRAFKRKMSGSTSLEPDEIIKARARTKGDVRAMVDWAVAGAGHLVLAYGSLASSTHPESCAQMEALELPAGLLADTGDSALYFLVRRPSGDDLTAWSLTRMTPEPEDGRVEEAGTVILPTHASHVTLLFVRKSIMVLERSSVCAAKDSASRWADYRQTIEALSITRQQGGGNE